jgi:hypothetical protein
MYSKWGKKSRISGPSASFWTYSDIKASAKNPDLYATSRFHDQKLFQLVSFYHCAFFFFLMLDCEAIGTAATPGLVCQPRLIMKMIVEKQIECRLARETEVLGQKTCPKATFVHHKMPRDQIRVWTRAVAVGSRRLTAWAMTRPATWNWMAMA